MGKTATPESTQQDFECDVIQLLMDIGMRTNVTGYYLIRDAIVMVRQDEKVLHSVTKRLYGALAETSNSTWHRVERSIRHCIALTWNEGDRDVLVKIFGARVYREGPPTVSHFITRLAQEVKLRQRRK